MSKLSSQLISKIGDSSKPITHRSRMLIDVMAGAQEGEPTSVNVAQEIFSAMENAACDDVTKQREEQLNQILDMIEHAPMRPATFIQMSKNEGCSVQHALVSMDNGDLAFVVAPDQEMARQIKLGSRVMLDGKGIILMHPSVDDIHTGHEARFERLVDDRHIEVTTHQDEKHIVLAKPELVGKIESGGVKAGASIVVGHNGRMAICDLPPIDKHADNFRFLERGAVPDVIVDRDIGSPPPVINKVAKHIREEMTRPELRRRFRLRSCITCLLAGVSGSGKTLAAQAIHRLMYEIMSEVTGTPVDQLPPRVFRFKNSQMLSMWLGESDKNVDRIFDEVEKITGHTHTNSAGKTFKLPVLVIIEEIDGMARGRGDSNDAVYDRILTTMLQRLDPNRHGLSEQLIVFLATTNEPHMVDPAMLRRIGGSIEVFGRLDRDGFEQVLKKHVGGLPASNGPGSQKNAWKCIINDINNWLFLEGMDKGVVELQYHGHAHPAAVKYHRDFLTGALVDRVVQQAATEAWEISITKNPKAGITRDQLVRAIKQQVDSIAGQLTPHNVGKYLDLPEGAVVTGIKTISKNVG